MLQEVVQSSRSGLIIDPKEGNVATTSLTGMTIIDFHLTLGAARNDLPVSPPHDLFKTFVYDKISRRKLSAPFSAFFLSVFYLGENVIEIWMSPLGSKWNIPALYFCWPYLSRSRLRWIKAARWNSCTFIRFTHFRIGQHELEKVNYSLDGLRSESLFLMSADLQ